MRRTGYSWAHADLKAKKTPYGKGLFAQKNLRKGTLLAIFGGYIMTLKEEYALPANLQDNAIQIEENFVIGARKRQDVDVADYVNHSCDPNAGIRGQISLVAMRNIKKGEQITFDYGTVLFPNKNRYYILDCACGAKICRKKITQNDWKLPALQKRYKGYFSAYLEEKIRKNR